jgi:sterol desaturase/sphingolipid hydroxylase (fatty acid hydroxylase superfamily)
MSQCAPKEMWPKSMERKYLWRVVAICLSLIWFFVTPVILKPHWEWFWSPFSPVMKQILLNEMGFFYFAIATALMLPIYAGNFNFFEQFRICERDWDWKSEKPEVRSAFWALSRRSLALFFFNYGLLVPALTFGKYLLLGDNMSFSVEDWPSYQTLFVHNIAMTLIHEIGFYWSHRLAHLPSLYKFHKVHHEYKQNTILASMHEHPIDYIITIAGPALLTVVVVAPHSFTLFQWIAWIIVANIDDHCGYEFPFSPVRWFWMAGGTDMHEFHHSKNLGCFASKLALYDFLFDSKQKYVDWRSRRLADMAAKIR